MIIYATNPTKLWPEVKDGGADDHLHHHTTHVLVLNCGPGPLPVQAPNASCKQWLHIAHCKHIASTLQAHCKHIASTLHIAIASTLQAGMAVKVIPVSASTERDSISFKSILESQGVASLHDIISTNIRILDRYCMIGIVPTWMVLSERMGGHYPLGG